MAIVRICEWLNTIIKRKLIQKELKYWRNKSDIQALTWGAFTRKEKKYFLDVAIIERQKIDAKIKELENQMFKLITNVEDNNKKLNY